MKVHKMRFTKDIQIPNLHKATGATILRGARLLAKGGLVAFPTETVYGLGANALDAKAVQKIFQAKGRPSDNPLIVHIATMKELEMVAQKIPAVALKLMKKFWPGPLTFVLPKKKSVPDVVTAGGKTVAVRMPDNKVALALIKAAKCPVAAPSANLAGKPSPTSAAHVLEDFGDNIDLIIDGGKTHHGLESTVIDVTGKKVEILRSGAVTADMLAKILGYKPKIVAHGSGKNFKKNAVRSPGLKYKHYAPSVPLILIGSTDEKKMVQKLLDQLKILQKKRMRAGVLCVKEHARLYATEKYPAVKKIVICGSLKKHHLFGQELYGALRKFNKKDIDIILAENIGMEGIGHVVFDRLSRAATKIIR